MACGFGAKPILRLALVFAAALLAGCDNTTVAFCSGSDEFCRNFIDNTFGDDDEPHPPNDDATATDAAFAVASDTPKVVETAIAQQTMSNLMEAEPDLVGLWLTASTLGKLIDADHVAVSEFLDQNRAWLTDTATPRHSPALTQGLSLFAEFAADKDPALAEAAASQTTASAANRVGSAVPTLDALANRIVANHDEELCCDTRTLSAASIVLCPMVLAQDAGDSAAARAACASATHWLADQESGATR